MSNTKFQLANTVTDPSNYERFTAQFALTTGVSCQLLAETAGTGTDDINIVLTPAGTGALIAGPPPDGGIVGGNARGKYAVDLQRIVSGISTRVASGESSALCGSVSCTASGLRSAGVAGDRSFVSGTNSVSVGYINSVSGDNACSFCVNNFPSASNSIAFGGGCRATCYGQMCYGSTRILSEGDAQASWVCACRQTINGTGGVELFLDGAGATYRHTVASDTSLYYIVGVVARNVNADEDAAWEFKGVIRNNAGTTTLTQFSKNVIHKNVAAWECDVVANDANDALKVQVTGVAGQTINWMARIKTVEVIA